MLKNEHDRQVELHKKLINDILLNENYLVIEFDFAQNLPVRKLPVNEQYYSRLLWLFAFNVHIHNSKNKCNDKKNKDNSFFFIGLP